MPRYIVILTLAVLVLSLSVLSSFVKPQKPARSSEPAKNFPPGYDHMPTEAEMAEHFRGQLKAEAKMREMKLKEARAKGMMFVKEGDGPAVPVNSYLMGDWYLKRADGNKGLRKVQDQYRKLDERTKDHINP